MPRARKPKAPKAPTRWPLEHTDSFLVNVHPESACAGRPCAVHNRTDHNMRGFPQHFRFDRGIIERICDHGVGHPDPDDPSADKVHGCDGCCRVPHL